MKFFIDHNIKDSEMLDTIRMNYTESVFDRYIDRKKEKALSIILLIVGIIILRVFLFEKTLNFYDYKLDISVINTVVKIVYAMPFIITSIISIIISFKLSKDKSNLKIKFEFYIIQMINIFFFIVSYFSIVLMALLYSCANNHSLIFSIMFLCTMLFGAICARYRSKERFLQRYAYKELRSKYCVLLTNIISMLLEFFMGYIFKFRLDEIIIFVFFFLFMQIFEISIINVLYEYHYFDKLFIKDIDTFLKDESFD